MKHKGKRLRKAYADINPNTSYLLEEGIQLIKTKATARFDETIEIAMNLGVDPRHADQMVRGMVSLPHGTGKDIRVAVFATGQQAQEAQQAGADIVGAEDLAELIQGGQINFDRCIAAPETMTIVAKLGKILGPRGLMPNPKLGTVTPHIADAVRTAKAGSVTFRVERAGIIHGIVGKASFSDQALIENLYTFVDAIQRAKPTGAKGTYIQSVILSSTMGPSLMLDLNSIKNATTH